MNPLTLFHDGMTFKQEGKHDVSIRYLNTLLEGIRVKTFSNKTALVTNEECAGSGFWRMRKKAALAGRTS
jgi:hypothetical protein